MANWKREPNEVERELQARFNPENSKRFSSTTREAEESVYVQDLVLDEDSRGRLPYTRDKFVVTENPAQVEWERQVRLFLSKLNKDFGHRVTAPMIYEWATGISIKDLVAEEGIDKNSRGPKSGSANMHLRHINKILRDYFGKPYKTTIMGRPVGQAYTVKPYFNVRNKKPMSLTLWPEWDERSLAV